MSDAKRALIPKGLEGCWRRLRKEYPVLLSSDEVGRWLRQETIQLILDTKNIYLDHTHRWDLV